MPCDPSQKASGGFSIVVLKKPEKKVFRMNFVTNSNEFYTFFKCSLNFELQL